MYFHPELSRRDFVAQYFDKSRFLDKLEMTVANIIQDQTMP